MQRACAAPRRSFQRPFRSPRCRTSHALTAHAASDASCCRVVGVGGVGIDYLASLAKFPLPDEKLRTECLQVCGGGNCGNALTAFARLGAKPTILSCIGDDAFGQQIIAEFNRDGVDTDSLLVEAGTPTPFTYIIVDKAGSTRTCIHTPGATPKLADITNKFADSLLEGADLLYCDGRLTEVAIRVAKAARRKGIPVLVEAERLRPNLESLMTEADFLVTSQHFPQNWTGEESSGDAMLAMALRLPTVKRMVTTFGKRGAVLLEASEGRGADAHELRQLIDDLFQKVAVSQEASGGTHKSCVACNGATVTPAEVVSTEVPVQLTFDREARHRRDALQSALHASAEEASASAAAEQAALFSASDHDFSDADSPVEERQLTARVYACSAAHLDADLVVDTTGAGDAFIAGLLYGLCRNKTVEDMLQLASVVSACNCMCLGGRAGAPTAESIPPELL